MVDLAGAWLCRTFKPLRRTWRLLQLINYKLFYLPNDGNGLNTCTSPTTKDFWTPARSQLKGWCLNEFVPFNTMQCHMIPEWYCVAIVVILSDQRSEYRKTGLAGILWLLSCMLHHGVNPLELTSWIFPFAQKLGGGALSGGGHWTLSAADWRSGLVIAGIMLCSTAALVIGGRVIYLWGLPVGGAGPCAGGLSTLSPPSWSEEEL